MIRLLFVFCFTVLTSLHSTDSGMSASYPMDNKMVADQSKEDKHYILESEETLREIQDHTEVTDMGWRDWKELYITYDLLLENGSKLKLTASAAGNAESLEEMFNTFYLAPGDEIEFFAFPRETAWRSDLGLKIRFTLIRNGVFVGDYVGWRGDVKFLEWL